MINVKQNDTLTDKVNITLLISGLIGFFLGLLYAKYQWIVGPAQILAGIVKYPPSNHFYILTMKSWSTLNQISALLLHFGVSEQALSFLWSGIMGMVSFMALSVGILILSRRVVFSLLASFFIFFIHGVWFQGINYPISLMGTEGPYTSLGLSFYFLVMCLFSAGYYKSGGLLLGLAPAIHATQGLWYTLVIAICIMWDFQYHKEFLKKAWVYIIIGYAISAVSLICHLLFFYEAQKISIDILSKYYYALIRYWTEHLMRFNLFTGNMARVIISLILSIWALRFLKNTSRNLIFFFRSFIVTAVIAGIFSVVYWLPPEKASLYYNLILMYPARLFNYNILGSFVVLVGLLGRFKDNRWVQLNLSIFVIALFVYKFIYKESSTLPLTPVSIGLMFMSSIALILSLPPFKTGTASMLELKNAWIEVHLIALIVAVFYCFSPFFKGSFFVPFIAILIATIVIMLSIEIFKKYESKNNYRLLFILEGLCFIIFGFLWSLTKSEHPVFLGEYSSAIFVGIVYILIAGFMIVLSSYFWRYKLSIVIGDIFIKQCMRIEKSLGALKSISSFFLILIMVITLTMAYDNWRKNMKSYFLDWTKDQLYAELRMGKGMILTGPGADEWFMLRTRRPVLYNGGSSILTYAPEAGPEFNNMWKKVYGVDFLNPPEGLQTIKEGLPSKSIKILWESRSAEEWRNIKKEFGVNDIVTLSGWKLNLPEAARNDKFTLYKIPGGQ